MSITATSGTNQEQVPITGAQLCRRIDASRDNYIPIIDAEVSRLSQDGWTENEKIGIYEAESHLRTSKNIRRIYEEAANYLRQKLFSLGVFCP